MKWKQPSPAVCKKMRLCCGKKVDKTPIFGEVQGGKMTILPLPSHIDYCMPDIRNNFVDFFI